jgi:DNA-binding transcriptional LysR family regulator
MSHDPFEPPLDAIVGVQASDGRGRAPIEVIPLFDDPMYVVLPLGHHLADLDTVTMASLAAEPWMIATPKSCPDSKLLLRACHAAGFEPRIAFENDDYSAVLGFVAAGVGVALIPDMIARVARAAVVIRPLDPPPPPRPITAVVPVGYRSPAAEALLEVLGEVAEEWVRDGADPSRTRVDVTYEVQDAAVEDAAA